MNTSSPSSAASGGPPSEGSGGDQQSPQQPPKDPKLALPRPPPSLHPGLPKSDSPSTYSGGIGGKGSPGGSSRGAHGANSLSPHTSKNTSPLMSVGPAPTATNVQSTVPFSGSILETIARRPPSVPKSLPLPPPSAVYRNQHNLRRNSRSDSPASASSASEKGAASASPTSSPISSRPNSSRSSPAIQSPSRPSSFGGPNTNTIGHVALNKFWCLKIYPKTAIKTNAFISQLVMHLAVQRSMDQPAPKDNESHAHDQQLPESVQAAAESRRRQYKMMKARIESERQIINLFGGKSKEFEEFVAASIDFDGLGIVTAIKLDRVTRHIPRDSSLLVLLYQLYHQRGIELLPPMIYSSVANKYVSDVNESLRQREEIVNRVLARVAEENNRRNLPKLQGPAGLIESPFTPEIDFNKTEFPAPVLSYDYLDIVGEDPMSEVIMSAFGTVGWHLVGGLSCIGKSVRVISALKKFLKSQRTKYGQDASSSSVEHAVNTSNNILDPLKSSSGHGSMNSGLRREGFIDAVYLDLRGCHSSIEVMSTISSQLALKGESSLELDVFWHKLLESLRPNSVVLVDNVSSAQCAIVLTQLLDTYARTLCIMVVSAGRLGVSTFSGAGSGHSGGTTPGQQPIECSVPFASPVRIKDPKFTFEAIGSPTSTSTPTSLSTPASASKQQQQQTQHTTRSSSPSSYDDVFIDVYEGLGGNARINLTPFKKTIYYLDNIPSTATKQNSTLIAKRFLEQSKLSTQGMQAQFKKHLNLPSPTAKDGSASAAVPRQFPKTSASSSASSVSSNIDDFNEGSVDSLSETISFIAAGDISTMKLLCSSSSTCSYKSVRALENLLISRNVSMPESIAKLDKITADDVFINMTQPAGNNFDEPSLYDDRDCLAIITACTPLLMLSLYQTQVDVEVLWSLSKPLFMAMYCTRGNFGNVAMAKQRFDVAVYKLWVLYGWLEVYEHIHKPVYTHLNLHNKGKIPVLCISTAATRATQLFEHAIVSVLDRCRHEFKSKDALISCVWNAYYAHWVRVLEGINLEFIARGQTLTTTCQCTEALRVNNIAQASNNTKISDNKGGSSKSKRVNYVHTQMYTYLTMRELLDVVDRYMIHFNRLFSMWLRTPTLKDINTNAIISIITSSRLQNNKHSQSTNSMVISPAKLPQGGRARDKDKDSPRKDSPRNSPRESPRRRDGGDEEGAGNMSKSNSMDNVLMDEKTLEYLPELRSMLDESRLKSCSYDPFDYDQRIHSMVYVDSIYVTTGNSGSNYSIDPIHSARQDASVTPTSEISDSDAIAAAGGGARSSAKSQLTDLDTDFIRKETITDKDGENSDTDSQPPSGASSPGGNKSLTKSGLLSDGPISTVFRGSGRNAKLAAVFTSTSMITPSPRTGDADSMSANKFNDADSHSDLSDTEGGGSARKSEGLLMSRSFSAEGLNSMNNSSSVSDLRNKERERKRAVQEYITSEPSTVAEAMVERRNNNNNSSSSKYGTRGDESSADQGQAGVGHPVKKPANLKEIIFPLARNMSITLSKRVPIFGCVEIMKSVTEKLPNTSSTTSSMSLLLLVLTTTELGEFMSMMPADEVQSTAVEKRFA
jgi:hypothetical protein